MKNKLFGIYTHQVLIPTHPLLRGFDDCFLAPHSRYTYNDIEDIKQIDDLDVVTYSEEAGVHICADRACRKFFISGHSEYDRCTLAGEYARDREKGLDTQIPKQYYPNDNPNKLPNMNWRSAASLIFSNWVNHIVYQHTPFDLNDLIDI